MSTFGKQSNSGLTLVEVLVSTTIVLVFLLALLGAHNLYLKSAFSNGEVVKATKLAEESLEIIRFFRDSSWDTNIAPLALGTDYGLVVDGGSWKASTTNLMVDSFFERKIRLSAVYRSVTGDIVTSGGTLDTGTLLVDAVVSWPKNGATTTQSISTYITDLFTE